MAALRQSSPDEIAAGFRPDGSMWRGTSFPIRKPENWQANTERSARALMDCAAIPLLSVFLCSSPQIADIPPEWHVEGTNLNFATTPHVPGTHVGAVKTHNETLIHQRLLTASIGVQAREALAALILTKGQMAEILGIERPHLYAWLADKVERPAKGERLRDLLKILAAAGISSAHPLRGHLLTEPLEPGAKPLLTLLKAKDLGSDAIASALSIAVRLNRAMDDDANRRQARMRAAGHHQPSDEEAKATLDTTLTMMEWEDA